MFTRPRSEIDAFVGGTPTAIRAGTGTYNSQKASMLPLPGFMRYVRFILQFDR